MLILVIKLPERSFLLVSLVFVPCFEDHREICNTENRVCNINQFHSVVTNLTDTYVVGNLQIRIDTNKHS